MFVMNVVFSFVSYSVLLKSRLHVFWATLNQSATHSRWFLWLSLCNFYTFQPFFYKKNPPWNTLEFFLFFQNIVLFKTFSNLLLLRVPIKPDSNSREIDILQQLLDFRTSDPSISDRLSLKLFLNPTCFLWIWHCVRGCDVEPDSIFR